MAYHAHIDRIKAAEVLATPNLNLTAAAIEKLTLAATDDPVQAGYAFARARKVEMEAKIMENLARQQGS